MYPRVVISKEKLYDNTKIIVDKAKSQGLDVFVVTKVFCGQADIAQICLDAGAKGVMDSRLENLVRMTSLNAEKVLLRLPMSSEVDKVVKHADVSLNSELETIKKLNCVALEAGKKHKIILMVDLGDLREGLLPEDVPATVREIMKLEGIELVGVGVNLTCYGGVIPTEENLTALVEIARLVESITEKPLTYVSGGNSSSLYLLDNHQMPRGINHLRVGEAIVLGRETAYGEKISGTHDDVFVLEAEIIELKTKGSVPKGLIGMDAFGNKPTFEDKGNILRAIVAVGHQDVDAFGLEPLDAGVEVLGASSDHMILNLTSAVEKYELGGIVKFKMGYGAMLKLFTSEFVAKVIEK